MCRTELLTHMRLTIFTAILLALTPSVAIAQNELSLVEKKSLLTKYVEKLRKLESGLNSSLKPHMEKKHESDSEYFFSFSDRKKYYFNNWIHSVSPTLINNSSNRPLSSDDIDYVKNQTAEFQDGSFTQEQLERGLKAAAKFSVFRHETYESLLFTLAIQFHNCGYHETVNTLLALVKLPFSNFCATQFELLLAALTKKSILELRENHTYAETAQKLKNIREQSEATETKEIIDFYVSLLKKEQDNSPKIIGKLRTLKKIPVINNISGEFCDLSLYPKSNQLIFELLKSPTQLKEILSCKLLTRVVFIEKQEIKYHTVGTLCYLLLSIASCGNFQVKEFYRSPYRSRGHHVAQLMDKKISEATQFFSKLDFLRILQIALEFSEARSTIAFQQLLIHFPKSITKKHLARSLTKIKQRDRLLRIGLLTVEFAPRLINTLIELLSPSYSEDFPALWYLNMEKLLIEDKATIVELKKGLIPHEYYRRYIPQNLAIYECLQRYVKYGKFKLLIKRLSKTSTSFDVEQSKLLMTKITDIYYSQSQDFKAAKPASIEETLNLVALCVKTKFYDEAIKRVVVQSLLQHGDSKKLKNMDLISMTALDLLEFIKSL